MNILKHSLLTAICLSVLVPSRFPTTTPVRAATSNYQYAFIRDHQLGFIDPAAPEKDPAWYALSPDFGSSYPQVSTSPDGHWIAVAMPIWGMPTTKLQLFNVLLGTVQPPIQIGNGFPTDYAEVGAADDFAQEMAWSPDSRYLALNMYGPDHADIYVYSIYDQTLADITALDSAWHYRLAWSSDSKQIVTDSAFCEKDSSCSPQLKLKTFDLEGKIITSIDLSNLFADYGWVSICNLGWSPDDQYIYFKSSCNGLSLGQEELYLWDTTQNAANKITNFTAPFQTGDPAAPYANYIVLWTNPHTMLISTSFIDSKTVITKTRTVSYDTNSHALNTLSSDLIDQWAINPVSGQIAFRRIAQADVSWSTPHNSTVHLGQINANILTESPFLGASQIVGGCDLSWSPDGKYLAYTTRQGCSTDHMTGIGFWDSASGSLRQHIFPDDSKIKYYLPAGWVITPGQGNTALTPPPPVVLTVTAVPSTGTPGSNSGGIRD